MSSPTILFILKRFLDRHHAARREGLPGLGSGVAMAFGPGLTLEGALFRQVLQPTPERENRICDGEALPVQG